MTTTKFHKIGLLSAVLLAGCPTTNLPADGGVPPDDAPVGTDAPETVDGGTTDGGTTDGGTTDDAPVVGDAGSCSCAADEICVADACIPSCGATAADLEGALTPGLEIVAHYCRSPMAWSTVGDHVYEVATRTEGMTTHFDLLRWTAVPGVGDPTTEMLGTTSRTAAATGETTFLGGYVAVSPNEAHAVFGFTTYPGTVGGVFDVATADGMVVASDASGNFDAVFVSDTRCIVNGLALGTGSGQGLYELTPGTMGGALVADGMGDASGSISYWRNAALVVAGGASFGSPFPTGESSRVFFVSPESLDTAAHADLSSEFFYAGPSFFELLPGDGVATPVWGATAIESIEVRWLVVDSAGDIIVGAAEPLTTDGTFTLAAELDGDIALQHTGGLLVVRQVDGSP